MTSSHNNVGRRLPRVLIGSLTRENKGAIPTITRAIIDGLRGRFEFTPHYSNRRFGLTATSDANLLNILYFLVHWTRWMAQLVIVRPAIVHYPVTSQWNLEKSAAFLRAGRLVGAKTVGHLNGGAFDSFWNRIGGMRKAQGLSFLRHLDAFVVTGEGWRQWSVRTLGLDPEKVFVVTNPIEWSFEREAMGFPATEDTRAFFVGSLGKRKGVFDILATAAVLQREGTPVPMVLSGPEDRAGDLARIRETVAQEHLASVQVQSGVYGDQKVAFFRDHGIFLFPSYNENFPLVVIEAAAAGRAIITTRVGALPEFFAHEQSLIFVEPGNIQEIVGALLRLRSDGGLRRRLGAAARMVFRERLANSRVAASLDHVYRRLLGMGE